MKFAEGKTIQGKVFAGKGTKVEIRDKYDLESIYDVPPIKFKRFQGEGIGVNGKEKQKYIGTKPKSIQMRNMFRCH